MSAKSFFQPILWSLRIGLIVLLVAALFGLGIPALPDQGMNRQVVQAASLAVPVSPLISVGVAGTLTSFTAFIVASPAAYLPMITR